MPSRCCPVEVVTKGGTDHKYTRGGCHLDLLCSCGPIDALIMLIHYSHSWNFLLLSSCLLSHLPQNRRASGKPCFVLVLLHFPTSPNFHQIVNQSASKNLLLNGDWVHAPCPRSSTLSHLEYVNENVLFRLLGAPDILQDDGVVDALGVRLVKVVSVWLVPLLEGEEDLVLICTYYLNILEGRREEDNATHVKRGQPVLFRSVVLGDERTVEAWEKNTHMHMYKGDTKQMI